VSGLQSCELQGVAGAEFTLHMESPPLESLESVWGTEGKPLVGPDWLMYVCNFASLTPVLLTLVLLKTVTDVFPFPSPCLEQASPRNLHSYRPSPSASAAMPSSSAKLCGVSVN
jgi:hypothetical protein